MSNVFEHENNELLEICNYDLEVAKEFIKQFQEFIEQLEESEIREEYEKITSTQELIDKIQEMEYFDIDKVKQIAYRLDLFDPEYTCEVKEQIIARAKVIEFNNLDKSCTFESIKEEVLEMIKDIATDYGVRLNENEEER